MLFFALFYEFEDFESFNTKTNYDSYKIMKKYFLGKDNKPILRNKNPAYLFKAKVLTSASANVLVKMHYASCTL